jgi:hypothetical protein
MAGIYAGSAGVASAAQYEPGVSSSSAAAPVQSLGARQAAAAALPAETITFSEVALGTTVTTQYLSRGVQFTSSVFTATDTAQPGTPALSGTPRFQGPISARFTVPGTTTPATVDGFSVDVGYIDNRDSVAIDYFDAAGQRLGSRSAQAYGINHITIAVRGVASFSVHTVSFEAAGFTIDNLALQRGAAGIRPTRMAMLGDSYSSGEGLIPEAGLKYDCGTDLDQGRFYTGTTMSTRYLFWDSRYDCDIRNGGSTSRPGDLFSRGVSVYENHCHRHGRAYPNQIRGRLGVQPGNAIFVACSGAVAKNIGLTDEKSEPQWPKSPAGVAGGELQYKNVDDWAKAGGNPDAVTIGVGGNDAGFVGIITKCAAKDCAADWEWRDGVINGINGFVFERLEQTFARLRARFPAATMFAFGYPSVVAEGKACPGLSLGKLGIQADERAWVADELMPSLNAAIADAAAETGMTYVDITAATAGHEICSDEAWINGLRGGTDRFNAIANESFHPNQNGHDAIAKFFTDHYTDGNGQLIAGNPAPVSNIRPAGGHEIIVGQVDAGAVRDCGASCLQPTACVQACSLRLQGKGFSPGVQLQGTLLPDPTQAPQLSGTVTAAQLAVEGQPIGSFTTDADGHLVADVRLPAGISPGEHAIELAGEDPDGIGQSAVAAFYVFLTEPPPTRTDPVPAPVAAPKPKPLGASLKVLGWKGRKLYMRVGCPKAAPSTCRVSVALQAPGARKKAAKGKKPELGKPRTLRSVTVTLKAGRSRVLGLDRGRTSVARKKLRLLVTTTTSLGAATSSRSLKTAKTIRKVPKR